MPANKGFCLKGTFAVIANPLTGLTTFCERQIDKSLVRMSGTPEAFITALQPIIRVVSQCQGPDANLVNHQTLH